MFPPVRREKSPIAIPACVMSAPPQKKELESVVATDCRTWPNRRKEGDHGSHTSKRLIACRRDRKRAADSQWLGCRLWCGVLLWAAIPLGDGGLRHCLAN